MMQAGRLGMATVLPYSNLNNFQLTTDNLPYPPPAGPDG